MMNTSWFSYRGLSPHKFTPMPGVHKTLEPIANAPAQLSVEAVEKVNLARIRRVGRKCNPSRCPVYDGLMLGRGQETPENHPLIVVRGFFSSLVSLTKQIWTAPTLSVYNSDRHRYADNQKYFRAIPVFLLQLRL